MGDHAFKIEPGSKVRLADYDPADTGHFKSKEEAAEETQKHLDRLAELQERLYAAGSHALLVVLQAMDTAGKDGVVKHVVHAFNPQGVTVTSFKVPTEEERAHDFLWRVHKAVPARGLVGVFNRSHYEEVLVVRVAKLKPRPVWSRHYDHINEFERLLADSGVKIVKLFLHISADEQEQRLRDRQTTPAKQWKFNPGDLETRRQWSQYMEAYEDALGKCNAAWAPWYVVPANHKWYRNLAVSAVLVKALEELDLGYPKPVDGIAGFKIPPAG
jgi:PPK2 family polyphosphate:nucleotide phosphotransferase